MNWKPMRPAMRIIFACGLLFFLGGDGPRRGKQLHH